MSWDKNTAASVNSFMHQATRRNKITVIMLLSNTSGHRLWLYLQQD